LNITAGSLQWADTDSGMSVSEITVLDVLFTSKGKVLSHGADELYAAVQGRIRNPDQRAAFAIHVPPVSGASRLRVVARDVRSGKIGTAEMTW
jgi:hypothetical protein